MGVRSKTLLIILLIAGVIGGGYYLNMTNPELFKGMLVKGGEVDPELERVEREQGLVVDLEAAIEVEYPEAGSDSDDITAIATLKNVGDGSILGNTPFRYTLYINDTEVFTNIDSYTTWDPGDEFSFNYPISREIYQYGDEGTVKFMIDTEDTIKEADEDNNEAEVNYEF